jgi:hypothetical protein
MLTLPPLSSHQAPNQVMITDKRTFLEFFSFHRGKKIILVIDEFDLLLSHKDAYAELCDALRSMKVFFWILATYFFFFSRRLLFSLLFFR